ncbi:MAG: hypothetical protein IJ486_10740 [Firmicutes bacterium]|nr:hypothetical protein [Bacillota bacterium]
MSLREIRGNTQILQRMKEAAATQVVSHAYILEGDASVDKLRLAREFVKAVICEHRQNDGTSCDLCVTCQKVDHDNHEDIFYVSADGNSIKDEAIEEMQRRLANRPNAGNRNIVIVEQADTMTLRAQNRLLKTLEEPAPGTVILLLSENSEHLAQTVRSRCILYRLHSLGTELEENIKIVAAETGEQWLNGEPFYKLVKAMEPALADKTAAAEFLDAMEIWLRDCMISLYDQSGALTGGAIAGGAGGQNRWPQSARELKEIARNCGKESIYNAIEACEEARQDLERNINTGYALKGMLLK